MRHLRSILYALVLAPAVWILCGVGFDQNLTLSGVLLTVLAGTAYAILLFSPISPAGPLLAGLAFLGAGAWARIAPASYAGAWPANVPEDGFDVSTPGYALAVLLAVPLVGTALSARRWRGFEPPELLLIGTIGRARGAAGASMASERTAVIPQERQGPGAVPGFGEPSADTTQVAGPASEREEHTQVLSDARGPDDSQTGDLDRTGSVAATDQPTHDMAANQPTREVAASGAGSDATMRDSTTDEATRDLTADQTTRDINGGVTTRLPMPADADAASDDGSETTRLLTKNAGGTDRGEQTQVIRAGTVQPPGDRTQLLTYRVPGEASTVVTPVEPAGEQTRENTSALSIVAAERPDPGEEPTTRLSVPGEATTRPNQERRAMSATNLERPADEAADDTRRLTLPAQRSPSDGSTA